jgi:hypothetical protein
MKILACQGRKFPQPLVLQEINTPWQVTFEHGKRGPVNEILFEHPQDWAESKNDSIKYFSGTCYLQEYFYEC